MAYKKRKKGRFKLTVKKGRKRWTLTGFKSKSSRDRAKRGLRTKGWR